MPRRRLLSVYSTSSGCSFLAGQTRCLRAARVDAAIATFTAEFFAKRAGWGHEARDPIFVVGMPRAGSTLIEQILSSHSLVEGTSELADIPRLARRQPGYPKAVANLSADECRALGEDYLDLHRKLGLTTIMITHDMAEALLLADRVAVMHAGRLLAQGTAQELAAIDDSYVSELLRTPRRQAKRLQTLLATDKP